MVNTDGSTADPALEQLKDRRRTARRDRRAAPPAPRDPITVRSDELNGPIGVPRSLAAPTVSPPEVVSGPFAADELHDYVTAEEDAVVAVVPRGCTTSVSQVLWHKGDRVQRAVHQAYLETKA
jgi:hypothetical protein